MKREVFAVRHFWDAPKTGAALMASATACKEFVPSVAAFWVGTTLFFVGCILVGFRRKPVYEPLVSLTQRED